MESGHRNSHDWMDPVKIELLEYIEKCLFLPDVEVQKIHNTKYSKLILISYHGKKMARCLVFIVLSDSKVEKCDQNRQFFLSYLLYLVNQ